MGTTAERLDPEKSVTLLGLDSLMAVEPRIRIERELAGAGIDAMEIAGQLCGVDQAVVHAHSADGPAEVVVALQLLYWVRDLKAAVWGSPLWVDHKVYLPTEDGEVWVFVHGREEKLLGRIEMDQPIRSTPVAANGVLYIMTESTLYAIAGK